MALCSASPPGEAIKTVKGETIRAKTHAEIGTTAHLSIIGDEGTGCDRDNCEAVKNGVMVRPNSNECIKPLDILALPSALDVSIGVRPGCPLIAQYIGPAVSINSRINVMILQSQLTTASNPPSCLSLRLSLSIYLIDALHGCGPNPGPGDSRRRATHVSSVQTGLL